MNKRFIKKLIGLIMIAVGLGVLLSSIGLNVRQYFSKEKTIKEFKEYIASGEGFSEEDAAYGAENCGADWNEQAVNKAKDYLNTMAFSEKGLTDQLKHEGFTEDEAAYGVKNCEADWNEQCEKKAQEYINTMSMSEDGLRDQLAYEGFSDEQIEKGLAAAGY